MADNEFNSSDVTNLDDDKIKLVAYYIVSIRPGAERMLPGGIGSLMVTERMTEDEFVAWIIARYFQTEQAREAVAHEEKQYLRVSYSVIDRWDEPCYDWQEERVKALRSIHETLDDPPASDPEELKTMIVEALTAAGRFLRLEDLAELCGRPEDEIKACLTDLKHEGRVRQVVKRYGIKD